MNAGHAPQASQVDLEGLFAALAAGTREIPSEDLTALSDVDAGARQRVRDAMRSLDQTARFAFLERLIELAEERLTLDYSAICLDCLEDDVAAVRALAASGLAQYEDPQALIRLAAVVADDPDEQVRVETAAALGTFALQGEFGRLQPRHADLVANTLRALVEAGTEAPVVQAAALESLGVISAEWVRDLIHDIYAADDPDLRVGALRAMGRSADVYWLPTIADALTALDEDERVAAAFAAGEIGDEDAAPLLRDLLEDESPEVVLAVIAALGEIGGPEAREALQEYATHPDAALRTASQAALQSLTLGEDPLELRKGGR